MVMSGIIGRDCEPLRRIGSLYWGPTLDALGFIGLLAWVDMG
jgi:hypothetical protein